MSDLAARTLHRDTLAYGEIDGRALKLLALGSASREAGSGPMRAAKGPEPVGIHTERELTRCRPGVRTQGASLIGWLRIVSAPLRSYDGADDA
jgi:hypothetical protein